MHTNHGVVHLVFVHIAKRVSRRDEFNNLRVDGILSNCEASLYNGVPKARSLAFWDPPLLGVLKLNVGVTKGKSCPAGIEGI